MCRPFLWLSPFFFIYHSAWSCKKHAVPMLDVDTSTPPLTLSLTHTPTASKNSAPISSLTGKYPCLIFFSPTIPRSRHNAAGEHWRFNSAPPTQCGTTLLNLTLSRWISGSLNPHLRSRSIQRSRKCLPRIRRQRRHSRLPSFPSSAAPCIPLCRSGRSLLYPVIYLLLFCTCNFTDT